jgi:hypothetical protein
MKKTFEELLGKGSKVGGELMYPKNYILKLMKEIRESTIKECANVATTKLTSTSIVVDKDIILQLNKNSIEIYEI